MTGITIGYALCGSFCTMAKAIEQMKLLQQSGANIIPIMSPIVYETDTRFGNAGERRELVEKITGNPVWHTIAETEPIGPKSLLDLLIIAPCTGNTMGKIALGITDTSVTMAAKAHLRNGKPVLIAMATNDALSGSAANIGRLLGTKGMYFVPYGQDDPDNKSTSMICDFSKILPAAKAALAGKQLQPLIL